MVVYIFEKPRSACDIIEKPRSIAVRLMTIKCNNEVFTPRVGKLRPAGQSWPVSLCLLGFSVDITANFS